MISKISAVSPNFSGSVRIGKNKEERKQIAKDILNVPDDNRAYFIESINSTKAILAARTPESVKLTLNVRKSADDEGLYQGITVYATDSDKDDSLIVGKPVVMDYVFDGEENGYFGVDINDKLSDLRESVLNDVAAGYVPKQSKETPKTVDEVLERLN